MKKSVCFAIACLLWLCAFVPVHAAQADPIRLSVNGVPFEFTDAQPFVNAENRTLVPLRAAAEAMEITVNWNPDTNTATFETYYTLSASPRQWDNNKDGENDSFISLIVAEFQPELKEYAIVVTKSVFNEKNGTHESTSERSVFSMDTTPVLKDGRVYAPIRYLSDAFYFDVIWDSATNTVALVDRLTYNFYYVGAYAPAAGKFDLVLTNTENIVSATFTDAVLATYDDTGAIVSEVSVPFTAFGADVIAADKIFAGLIKQLSDLGHTDVLGGLTARHDFKPNTEHRVIITFSGLKTNGARFTDTVTLHIKKQ